MTTFIGSVEEEPKLHFDARSGDADIVMVHDIGAHSV